VLLLSEDSLTGLEAVLLEERVVGDLERDVEQRVTNNEQSVSSLNTGL
jgi:hypothetical protein